MANLIISFARKKPPLQGSGNSSDTLASWRVIRGVGVRTEMVAISGGSLQSSMSANDKDDIVVLRAKADCWVAVGSNPTAAGFVAAVPPAGSPPDAGTPAVIAEAHYMLSGEVLELSVRPGDKVAVITA